MCIGQKKERQSRVCFQPLRIIRHGNIHGKRTNRHKLAPSLTEANVSVLFSFCFSFSFLLLARASKLPSYMKKKNKKKKNNDSIYVVVLTIYRLITCTTPLAPNPYGSSLLHVSQLVEVIARIHRFKTLKCC